MFELMDAHSSSAVIKVIGVGGGAAVGGEDRELGGRGSLDPRLADRRRAQVVVLNPDFTWHKEFARELLATAETATSGDDEVRAWSIAMFVGIDMSCMPARSSSLACLMSCACCRAVTFPQLTSVRRVKRPEVERVAYAAQVTD